MTPAIERLIQLAEVARTRIQSLSPVADALVYELGEAIDAAEKENDALRDALNDMWAGWRYIRASHGDMYGVGWDRCEAKAEAALGHDIPIIEDRRRENGE